MTRKEAERQTRQADVLRSLGFTREESETLRRISNTLCRWYELECGDSNEYGSWAIERDANGDGPPYMVRHHYGHGKRPDSVTHTRIADRERGAIKRLQAIVAARNKRNRVAEAVSGVLGPVAHNLSYYLQTDPRGCALYIIRPGDVPEGQDVSAYYSRGIVVY